MQSHIDILKQRVNMLIDEHLRIEGALREVRHLINFFENGAVEPEIKKPSVEVEQSQPPVEAKE